MAVIRKLGTVSVLSSYENWDFSLCYLKLTKSPPKDSRASLEKNGKKNGKYRSVSKEKGKLVLEGKEPSYYKRFRICAYVEIEGWIYFGKMAERQKK